MASTTKSVISFIFVIGIEVLHDHVTAAVLKGRTMDPASPPPGTYIHSYVKNTILPAFQHGRCPLVMQSLYYMATSMRDPHTEILKSDWFVSSRIASSLV